MPLVLPEAVTWAATLIEQFVVDEKYLDSDVADAYLDGRDTDPFDADWVGANDSFEQEVAENFSPAEIEGMERAKEKWAAAFFQKVIRATRNPDLASYLSDDFALVLGWKMIGTRNDFAERVAKAFERNAFPE